MTAIEKLKKSGCRVCEKWMFNENCCVYTNCIRHTHHVPKFAKDEFIVMDVIAEAMQPETNGLTFDQCLKEEFLINTQNYPREYHKLFLEKYNRAKNRFEEQMKTFAPPAGGE